MAFPFTLKLGLTGGIGCGKSTVVEIFDQMDWRTMKTDDIVHDLLATHSRVHEALRQRWGSRVISSENRVDRNAIADRVFNDENELNWLEQLLHPLVRNSWESTISNDPESNWLVEVPLLFEKKP